MFRTTRLVVQCSQPTSYLKVPIHSKDQKLCIQCKYFIHPKEIKQLNIENLKYGYCKQSGMVHLVDGSIEYENVAVYREFKCKGNQFEPKDI